MAQIKIVGLEETISTMQSNADALKSPHIEDALLRGAFVLEAEAKLHAPVDTGFLRNSIYSETPYTSRRGAAIAGAGGGAVTPAPQIKRGQAMVVAPAEYAVHQEFGTIHQPGKPFMRPAMRASSSAIKAMNYRLRTLAEKLKK